MKLSTLLYWEQHEEMILRARMVNVIKFQTVFSFLILNKMLVIRAQIH